MRVFSSAGGRMVAGTVATMLLIGTMAACGSSSTGGSGGSGSASEQAATLVAKGLQDYIAGNIQLANSEFQQAANLDPKNKYAWYNLGVIAQYNKDTKTATADYNRSLALDPNFESVLYNLGVLRYAASDWDG